MCSINAKISSPLHKAASIQLLPLHDKLPWLVAAVLARLLYSERAKRGYKGTWVR